MLSLNRIFYRRHPLNLFLQVRNGGGRPGGVPTFNWKEKKSINYDVGGSKSFEDKFAAASSFEELKESLKNEKFIDLTNLDKFEEEEIADESEAISDKKVINVGLLFGPNKPRGAIPRKDDYDHQKERRRYMRNKQ